MLHLPPFTRFSIIQFSPGVAVPGFRGKSASPSDSLDHSLSNPTFPSKCPFLPFPKLGRFPLHYRLLGMPQSCVYPYRFFVLLVQDAPSRSPIPENVSLELQLRPPPSPLAQKSTSRKILFASFSHFGNAVHSLGWRRLSDQLAVPCFFLPTSEHLFHQVRVPPLPAAFRRHSALLFLLGWHVFPPAVGNEKSTQRIPSSLPFTLGEIFDKVKKGVPPPTNHSPRELEGDSPPPLY